MADNSLSFRATLDDKVTGGLLKISKNFDKAFGKGSSASLFGNIGAKAVATGFSLLDRAGSAVIDMLGNAVEAALADEESQNRLAASLKANVPAWDGTTDAIERNILAQQRLGFSDETLRDSLTVLVGATHDVGEAQAIMATAMDLARFKGIDLKTASEALIKVEGGVFRSLKQLGIKLKDNATSTEALAAVQAVASGQAEAYARTNRGKLLASQIKLGEAMEKLGSVIMPGLVDAMVEIADHAEPIVESIGDVITVVGDVNRTLADLAAREKSFEDQVGITGWVDTVSNALLTLVDDSLDVLSVWDGWIFKADEVSVATSTFADKAADDLAWVGRKADAVADTIETSNTRITTSFDDLVTELKSDVQSLIDDVYDPIATRDRIAAAEVERIAQARIIKSKDSTDAEVADAKRRVRELQRDNVEYLTKLVESGDATTAEYDRLMKILKQRSASATGKAKADIDSLIRKIRQLHDVQVGISIRIHEPGYRPPSGAQHGGYRPPGWTGAVGEAGQEQVHVLPGGGIYVTPNQGQGMGGWGGTNVIQLVVDGRVLAEVVDDHMYRKLQRSAPTALRA